VADTGAVLDVVFTTEPGNPLGASLFWLFALNWGA
jgi:hypothetical protein